MQGLDITINPHTQDYDDLCSKCRGVAYETLTIEVETDGRQDNQETD